MVMNWASSAPGQEWFAQFTGYDDLTNDTYDDDYYYDDNPRGAYWSGDGRYAVAQAYDADREPVVVAVDPSAGKPVREMAGYYLVSIEPTGSVAWLVSTQSDQDPDGADPLLSHIVGGMYDAPVRALERWDLSSDEGPVKARFPQKTYLDGALGTRARLVTDSKRGANPYRVAIERAGAAAVDVDLPQKIATFRPIGWSPSGRYFALEELTQMSELKAFSDGGYDYLDEPLRYLVVVDGQTGAVTYGAPVINNGSSPAFWHADRDLVIWANARVYEGSKTGLSPDRPHLMAVTPGGDVVNASDALGFEEPAALKNFYPLLLGCEPQGIVIADDPSSAGWLIVGSTVTVATFDSVTGNAWNDRWGVVSMGEYTDSASGDQLDALRLYDLNGGPRRDLWLTAPPAPDEGGNQ